MFHTAGLFQSQLWTIKKKPETCVKHPCTETPFSPFCQPLCGETKSQSGTYTFQTLSIPQSPQNVFLVLQIKVSLCGQEVLYERLPTLRALWESTSFQLECLQANPLCVQQEEHGLSIRTQPYLKLTFDPVKTPRAKELGSLKTFF